MNDSDAITWLEEMLRDQMKMLEAMKDVDPMRFISLLTSTGQKVAALEHAAKRVHEYATSALTLRRSILAELADQFYADAEHGRDVTASRTAANVLRGIIADMDDRTG